MANVEAFDILKRSGKVAFYGVPSKEGEYTYHRMKGFTTLSTEKNPKEYSRQYVDEESERTDVVGYNTSISFGFDRAKGNAAHEDLVSIFDDEKIGAAAIRPIVIVDFENATDAGAKAVKRMFSVIPSSEGDGTDAYTYSGTFKTAGDKQSGIAESDDEWQTITFTEGSGE